MTQATKALAAALLIMLASVTAAQPPSPIEDTGIDDVQIRYPDQAEREGPVISRLNWAYADANRIVIDYTYEFDTPELQTQYASTTLTLRANGTALSPSQYGLDSVHIPADAEGFGNIIRGETVRRTFLMPENFRGAEMVNLSLAVTFDEVDWNFSSGGGSGNGGGGGGGSMPTTGNSLTVNHDFSLDVAQPIAQLESTTETAVQGFTFAVNDVTVTPSITRTGICFTAPTNDIWDAEDVRFNTGASSIRGMASWQGYDNQGRQCAEVLFPVTQPTDGAIEIGSMATYPAYNDADAAIARDVLASFGFQSYGVSASDDPLNPNKPAILSFSYGEPGMLSREAQQRQHEQVQAAVDRAIGMQTVSGPFVIELSLN